LDSAFCLLEAVGFGTQRISLKRDRFSGSLRSQGPRCPLFAHRTLDFDCQHQIQEHDYNLCAARGNCEQI